ncbi:hypothetical protein MBLNU459_g6277t1 [Dothideomycetes sp. NU459]
MGFTTGFIGGVALTSTLFYLSLNLHQRNRQYQSALLRQQSLVLDGAVSSRAAPPPPPPAREARAGLAERIKDRWNAELEANVRKLQRLDWDGLRAAAEEAVGSAWSRGVGAAREELPQPQPPSAGK